MVTWKDIRITTRYPSWFVASFIWPVIFPLTYFFVGRGLAGPDGQGLDNFRQLAETPDFASFLIIGNLIWMFVNINLWMGGMSLQQDRMRGTFDTQWCLPVSKTAIVFGATIASLILNFIPMVAAIIIYASFGALTLSGNFFQILGAIILVFPFLIGFLFTFAALTLRVRQAFIAVQVMRALLSILCGLQFPLAVLPESVTRIGQVIPLTHFVTVLRGVVIHQHSLGQYTGSLIYLAVSGVVMFILGWFTFSLVNKNVRRRGLSAGY
jgi:ABC-2 type transport system permease protein